jgi:hypothetical protein
VLLLVLTVKVLTTLSKTTKDGGTTTWDFVEKDTTRFTVALTTVKSTDVSSGAFSDLLNQNVVTTAGLAVGGTTAVVALGVATAAAPAVVVNGALLAGGLVYAGNKEHNGEYLLPFLHDDDEKTAKKARADKRKSDRAAKALKDAPSLEAAPATA